MQKYQDVLTIIGPPGLMPIVGANVTVWNFGTSTNASIFSDNISTAASNPLTTDSSGRYSFYAADGHYSLQFTGASIQTTTLTDISLDSSADGSAGVKFLQSGTGAVARTVQDKEREVVNMSDFGAALNGITDDTQNVLNAATALPGGGILNWTGALLIDSNLTLPLGISLVGQDKSPGQTKGGKYDTTECASILIINTAKTITLGLKNQVSNCYVIAKNLYGTLPFASGAAADIAVAAFAGTAFTLTSGTAVTAYDVAVKNILALGFSYSVFSDVSPNVLNRAQLHRIYQDCTNGIQIGLVGDLGSVVDCHSWSFTTANQSWSADSHNTRTGTAFLFVNANNTSVHRCFDYGHAIGFDTLNSEFLDFVGCDSEGVPSANASVGFKTRGTSNQIRYFGCTSPVRGGGDWIVDTATGNGGKVVSLFGCGRNSNANNQASYPITVTSGAVTTHGCDFYLATTAFVHLGGGTRYSSFGDSFATGSASTPILDGDATSMANATVVAANAINNVAGYLGPSCTWANLPSASTVVGSGLNPPAGRPFFVTDVGVGGSYWYSDGTRWKPMNGVVNLISNAIPMILPSSGSIGNNGALTALTALPTTYANCYMYFPANAIVAGSAAGLYFVQMSSTSAGTIFNNTYSSGVPTIPASPTPFVTTGPGAYAQTTGSALTILSVVVKGNTLGITGGLEANAIWALNSTAGIKTATLFYSTAGLVQSGPTTSVSIINRGVVITNRGVTNAQVCVNNTNSGATNTTPTYSSIDTTTDKNLTATAQLATATDFLLLESFSAKLVAS